MNKGMTIGVDCASGNSNNTFYAVAGSTSISSNGTRNSISVEKDPLKEKIFENSVNDEIMIDASETSDLWNDEAKKMAGVFTWLQNLSSCIKSRLHNAYKTFDIDYLNNAYTDLLILEGVMEKHKVSLEDMAEIFNKFDAIRKDYQSKMEEACNC